MSHLAKELYPSIGDLHPRELLGRITELKCGSCGGALQEVRHVYLPKPPPQHRKKRITKKWKRRWEKENRGRILASSMMGLMRKPTYRCISCGHNDSFYRTALRNFIQVQPMPEGALPTVGETHDS